MMTSDSEFLQYDPDDLKKAFRCGSGRNMERRLEAVAEVGAAHGREGAKEQVLDKLDDLIWRRKLHEKPYDQLEEIRAEVESL